MTPRLGLVTRYGRSSCRRWLSSSVSVLCGVDALDGDPSEDNPVAVADTSAYFLTVTHRLHECRCTTRVPGEALKRYCEAILEFDFGW